MLKNLVLTLSLSLAALPVFAQSAPAVPVATTSYQHCMLISKGEAYASTNVQLDYGQRAKSPVLDDQLELDSQTISKLGSVISALNYMSLRGWECINVSTITSKSNVYASTTNSEVGYLLRRRVR